MIKFNVPDKVFGGTGSLAEPNFPFSSQHRYFKELSPILVSDFAVRGTRVYLDYLKIMLVVAVLFVIVIELNIQANLKHSEMKQNKTINIGEAMKDRREYFTYFW